MYNYTAMKKEISCCRCQNYKWDWDDDIDYGPFQEIEDKIYCIFHAPNGMKSISADTFNAKVIKIIFNAKKKNKLCNLQGAIFQFDISFNADFYLHKRLSDDIEDITLFPAINLAHCNFYGKVDFVKIKFDQSNFTSTIFHDNVIFSAVRFSPNISFQFVIFQKDVNFYFTFFEGDVRLNVVKFIGSANFNVVQFEGKAIFSGSTFESISSFYFAKFHEQANLNNLIIVKHISMNEMDFTKVSFANTDLRKVEFINPKWPEKKSRRIVFDETLLSKEGNNNHNLVEALYRKLKQKYIDEHGWVEVSNWHYGEKEMLRKGNYLRRFLPFSPLLLYFISCGYGERPLRATIVLFFLTIILTFASAEAGLYAEEGSIYGINCIANLSELKDFAKFRLAYLNTLQIAIFKQPYLIPKTIFGGYIKFITQILVPIQSAFLVLALRNRFRR